MIRFLAALLLLLIGQADAATLTIVDGAGHTQSMNMQTTGAGAFSNRNVLCDATDPTICATVSASVGLATLATGRGSAGTPDNGVLTIQGIIGMTPVVVNNPTAANLKATVSGAGSSGTPDAGVVTIQGVTGMTPVQTTVVGGSSVTAIQTTAANLKTQATGGGSAGSADTGVLTVQGIASMTPVQVSQSNAANLLATVSGTVTAVQPTGASLHMTCDSGCSTTSGPADQSTFTFGSTSQTPIGGVFQTTATSNPLTNNQMGIVQLTAQRAMFSNLRNASGTEVGTASTPLQVSLANTGSNSTAVTVSQATAANLKATATGAGSAGSADAGVLTVQGIASMTPVQVSQSTAANLNATVVQSTAANLNATVTGSGAAGTAATGVVTVQGIASMTPVQVSQSLGTNLHVNCDSGCSSSPAPADESAFTFATTSQTPVGGVFQTTATNNALTTGQMGAFQVTANRALFTNLRNSSGTEVGTASTPLQVSVANTGANGTAIAVTAAQATAANLNATVVQSTAANLNATVAQSTAANLNATVVGSGVAGTPAGGVLSIQGVTSMTPVQVSQSTASSLNATVVQATGSNLHIVCDSGCTATSVPADESAFTAGTTGQTPVGGFFQTTATNNALTTGQMGAFQVTANRALFTNLRNASGTEIGTASNPVQVSLANTGASTNAIAVAQSTAANLNATVVQATATNLKALVNIQGNGGAIMDFAGQNAAAPANALLTGCVFNTTPTSLTSGNATQIQCDSSANQLVSLKTAIPPGANTIGAVTQASGPWSMNLTQIAGSAILTGAGTATSTPRVTVAQDTTTIAGSAPGTAGTASANVLTVQGITSMTPIQTVTAPSSASAVGITSVVSSAAENNHVLKASAGNLYSVSATNLTSTNGYLVLLNATSAPADGAITPLACIPLASNAGGSGFASIDYSPGPPQVYSTGITAVVTSASTCFTKTTGTITAFISGRVQ